MKNNIFKEFRIAKCELSTKKVYLLGAGVSKPLGIPISKELFKGVKNGLEQKHLDILNIFRLMYNAENYLRNKNMKTNIVGDIEEVDVEYVLSVLEYLKKVLDSRKLYIDIGKLYSDSREDFEFILFIFTYSSISNNLNCEINDKELSDPGKFISDKIVCFKNYLQSLKVELPELREHIRKHIYDKLKSVTLSTGSVVNYYEILFRIKEMKQNPNCKLIIFTTNYDLTIETAFYEGSLNGNFYFGMNPKMGRYVIPDNVQQIKNGIYSSKVSLIKLHGSLDWIIGDIDEEKRIVKAAPIENPESVYLIYPGLKNMEGTEYPEIFQRTYKMLQKVFYDFLIDEKIDLISIGYSFRDEEIYSIIRKALEQNKGLKLYSITPSFPDDSFFESLKELYPKRVIHYRTKILYKNNQLTLDPPISHLKL